MEDGIERTIVRLWLSDEDTETPQIWCGGTYSFEISKKSYESTWATHESLGSGLAFSVSRLAKSVLETIEKEDLPRQIRFVYGIIPRFDSKISDVWERLEKEGLKRYPAEREDFLLKKISEAYKRLE